MPKKTTPLAASRLTAGLTALTAAPGSVANAQTVPVRDQAMPYCDRHLIDIANLRYFTEGSMMANSMIYADAIFGAKDKWKMTLFQMIRRNRAHSQTRSALRERIPCPAAS